jgi:plastocyanin
MRKYPLLVVPLVLAVFAAACGGGGLYGGSATPTRPPAGSPTSSARPAAGTGDETPAMQTQAAPTAAPASLTVVARGFRFEQTELAVDAGAQVTITFDNRDTASHNLDIEGVAKTDIFAGPGQRTLTFTAPAPGTYAYRCDVHPNIMRGTLVVR